MPDGRTPRGSPSRENNQELGLPRGARWYGFCLTCMIFSISDDLSLIVPPWQRIDLSSMSSTMSTLDPMALSSHCNRHFDVFFKTKPFYCSGGNILRFESLLKYLNMEWEPGNHLYKDKVSKEFKKP